MPVLKAVRRIGCDCAVSIDADLQQDELAIESFVNEYMKGADMSPESEMTEKQIHFLKNLQHNVFIRQ